MNDLLFFKELYDTNDLEYQYSLIDRLFFIVMRLITGEKYGLPYVALRESGVDFIINKISPMYQFEWNEILNIKVGIVSFKIILHSGSIHELDYSRLDYSSIQDMKFIFSDRGF